MAALVVAITSLTDIVGTGEAGKNSSKIYRESPLITLPSHGFVSRPPSEAERNC